MKNRKGLFISAATLFAASLISAVGCSQKAGLSPSQSEKEYTLSYSSNYEGEVDAGFVFDGVLDEEAWKNKKSYRNTFAANVNGDLPSIEVVSFTTDLGVYIGATAYDTNLVSSGKGFMPGQNSCFELFYIAWDKDEELEDIAVSRRQLVIDLAGVTYGTGERIKKSVSVEGEINSESTLSATWEIFIAWEELGVDLSKGVPDEYAMLPTYRAILPGNTDATILFPGINVPAGHPMNYFKFGKDGYQNADGENALLGDSKIGRSKTANWDVSKADEGTVIRRGGMEWQTIYFKNSFDENFSVTTTMVPLGDCSNGRYAGQMAGIHLATAEGYHHSALLNFREKTDEGAPLLIESGKGGKNVTEYQLITLDNYFKSWNQVAKKRSANPNAYKKDGVEFRLIKQGNKAHYFLDGVYFMSEEISFLGSNACAGFYSLNENVEFRNCVYEAYSLSEVDQELETLGIYSVKGEAITAGGSVSFSDSSVYSGGSAVAEFTVKSGYEIESVLINGEVKTAEIRAAAQEGKYVFENVTENLLLQVKFKKVESANTLSGVLKAGESALGGELVLLGVDDPLYQCEIKASARSGFEVKAPTGKYLLKASLEGYEEYRREIELTSDFQIDVLLSDSQFPSVVSVNGVVASSYLSKWDLSLESEGKAIGSFELGTKASPLYLPQVGNTVVAKTTVTYSGGFEQGDLFGGFYITDGVNGGWITARLTGIAYNWHYVTGLWEEEVLTPSSSPENNTVEFQIVLYEGNFYVFVGGKHVYSLLGSQVNENFTSDKEYAFGLYMITDKPAEATFTDYSVTVGEEANALAKTLVEGKGSVKVTAKAHGGGQVTVSQNEIWKGESVKVSLLTPSQKTVGKITVDGEDQTAEFSAKAENGEFYLENVTSDLCVEVYFEEAQTRTYRVSAVFEGDILSCKATLLGVDVGLLRYEQKAGEGEECVFSVPQGNYRLEVVSEGVVTAKKNISIFENAREEVEMKRSAFAKEVSVGGKSLVSDMKNWDLSDEYNGKLIGSYELGTKSKALWFKESGDSAILSATVTYSGGFEQPDLIAGFILSNGVESGWVAVCNTGVLYTGWKSENGLFDPVLLNTSTASDKTADLRLIVYGDSAYFFVNGTFVKEFALSELSAGFKAGDCFAFSPYMVADKAAEATFSAYSLCVGEEAEGIIPALIENLQAPLKIHESKNAVYSRKTDEIKDINAGGGAAYLYLDIGADKTAYLKTKIRASDPTGDVLAGVTVKSGSSSAQLYLNSVGVLKLNDYAWSNANWWNVKTCEYIVNVPEKAIEESYKTGVGTGEVTLECLISDGVLRLFVDGTLRVQIGVGLLHSNFTATSAFRLGVASWDSKGRGYRFCENVVLLGEKASAVMVGRI